MIITCFTYNCYAFLCATCSLLITCIQLSNIKFSTTVENKTFSNKKALLQTVKRRIQSSQIKLVEMTGVEPATP